GYTGFLPFHGDDPVGQEPGSSGGTVERYRHMRPQVRLDRSTQGDEIRLPRETSEEQGGRDHFIRSPPQLVRPRTRAGKPVSLVDDGSEGVLAHSRIEPAFETEAGGILKEGRA